MCLLPCLPTQSDYISFRHHTYEMPRGAKSVELKECGPRFELKLYQIKLGTLDQPQGRARRHDASLAAPAQRIERTEGGPCTVVTTRPDWRPRRRLCVSSAARNQRG